MKITYLAHSCFALQNREGVTLLTDPCEPKTGYVLPKFQADVVTTSHKHMDHAYLDAIDGETVLIDTPGVHETKGIRVTGIPTKHDGEEGALRGDNILFLIESESIRVLHCGDLGHMLTDEQLSKIGKVDILMIPVGGTYTIDAEGAHQVVNALDPKVVIPMHYRTDVCTLPISPVEPFLERMKKEEYAISMHHASTKDYVMDGLPKRHTVLVMHHMY